MNEIKNEIKYFIQKINSIFMNNEVYIFDSYAYLTPNNDSDIDNV